jgi:hypothetical protein
MIIKTRPLQATVFVPASYFNPSLIFVATASSINISLEWAVKNYNITELVYDRKKFYSSAPLGGNCCKLG